VGNFGINKLQRKLQKMSTTVTKHENRQLTLEHSPRIYQVYTVTASPVKCVGLRMYVLSIELIHVTQSQYSCVFSPEPGGTDPPFFHFLTMCTVLKVKSRK